MDTLFHYCSPSSFVSIINTRNIWLSSLSLTNFSMEGKIVKNILTEICRDEPTGIDIVDSLLYNIKSIEGSIDGLGFCLSENGDLLSQWRGYSSDGTGFSIGFSREYLEFTSNENTSDKFDLKLVKIIYDKNEQKVALRPIFDEIKSKICCKNINKPQFNASCRPENYEIESMEEELRFNVIINDIVYGLYPSLISDLFTLKNEAFAEEVEWRLVSFMLKNEKDNCLIRYNGNRLVPYRIHNLISKKFHAIKEVIIGPKNTTPYYVVKNLLFQNGFTGVEVKKSRSTYC